MTDLAWTAIRADTIDRFNGQTPRPEDEAAIIDIFELHPQLVMRAIDETAHALKEAKITWAWSVLNARLTRGTTALREATVDTSAEKTKRVERAEAWIHRTGVLYDQEAHVEAELFGDDYGNGYLGDYAADTKLRERLLQLWRDNRHLGKKADADHLAYMAKCKTDRQHITDLKRQAEETLRRQLEEQAAREPATVAASAPGADIDFDT